LMRVESSVMGPASETRYIRRNSKDAPQEMTGELTDT
jgi:hypothetical protein